LSCTPTIAVRVVEARVAATLDAERAGEVLMRAIDERHHRRGRAELLRCRGGELVEVSSARPADETELVERLQTVQVLERAALVGHLLLLFLFAGAQVHDHEEDSENCSNEDQRHAGEPPDRRNTTVPIGAPPANLSIR
jgi:hypothetical protein